MGVRRFFGLLVAALPSLASFPRRPPPFPAVGVWLNNRSQLGPMAIALDGTFRQIARPECAREPAGPL
jgi:hypothetical protein